MSNPQELRYRLLHFNVHELPLEVAEKARNILESTSLMHTLPVSAGLGTFYIWVWSSCIVTCINNCSL
jgi:hypothetical protein